MSMYYFIEYNGCKSVTPPYDIKCHVIYVNFSKLKRFHMNILSQLFLVEILTRIIIIRHSFLQTCANQFNMHTMKQYATSILS